jgi:hypothetical protein
MTDGEKRLDDDILMILQRDAVPGNEERSRQSLASVSYKLAEELDLVHMADIGLREFLWTVSDRLIYLCAAGRVRTKPLSVGVEGMPGFQIINPLDALAEAVDGPG